MDEKAKFEKEGKEIDEGIEEENKGVKVQIEEEKEFFK